MFRWVPTDAVPELYRHLSALVSGLRTQGRLPT